MTKDWNNPEPPDEIKIWRYKQLGGNEALWGLIRAAEIELRKKGLMTEREVSCHFTYPVLAMTFSNMAAPVRDHDMIGVLVWEKQEHVSAAWINLIYVLPLHRNKGHAGRMMQAFAQSTKEEGLHRIRLGTHMNNAAALALYRKLGYEEEHLVLSLELLAAKP